MGVPFMMHSSRFGTGSGRCSVGLLAAGIAAYLLGCRGPIDRVESSGDWPTKGLAQQTLQIRVLEPIVRRGDSIPVMYAVRNDGPPLAFLNDPAFFTFSVLGPRGGVIEPEYLIKDNIALGPTVGLTIPTAGWWGREVNLACVTLGFESSQDSAKASCRMRYRPTMPGVYKVAMTYRREPPPGTAAHPSGASLILQSDTVRFEYRPRD